MKIFPFHITLHEIPFSLFNISLADWRYAKLPDKNMMWNNVQIITREGCKIISDTD